MRFCVQSSGGDLRGVSTWSRIQFVEIPEFSVSTHECSVVLWNLIEIEKGRVVVVVVWISKEDVCLERRKCRVISGLQEADLAMETTSCSAKSCGSAGGAWTKGAKPDFKAGAGH